MRGAGAAGRATGAGQSFVHDLADRARATAALSAAAETAIDLTGRARRRSRDRVSHRMVAENVAGAHDHRKRLFPEVSIGRSIGILLIGDLRQVKGITL